MQAITATELARQTRQILDTVARQGQTIIIERNHVPVARLVPPEPTMTAAQALAGLPIALTPLQADAWLADSRTGFDDSVRDSWA
ncbi:type II toxin-antitoxin system Phd/YefM family antitoxin [Mycetohabitans sp. B5]|uniref:Antitoxin (DNA-binding transcriptional repressor) of toxin-antitoxin stability system n=1 Tax=Mycetohabitans endofungorum TaxID=417203 RepID=A0A2P5K6R8_9BURK|nr:MULTISPECIES: type II toxin-antitoxin system Phd/YefM family antitoxin [Mycetohabitans]MCG1055992.1 type II toxin-antitoxin system Phd/YefM family antitoxin [Mycetohabitans sp. B5]PPB81027.1 antitoxin (DNA-binding transcriptional repressor) of toxin-antitoxin stability system [Mycetohabitans endofungorum]